MTEVELRRLELRDLNAIETIERRAYPTPWSRSMFAGELAKPTSLCVGAFDEDEPAHAAPSGSGSAPRHMISASSRLSV